MVYVWLFILFLIIIRNNQSSNISNKAQKWINIFLVLSGCVAIGIVVYAYLSVNR